MLMMVVLVLGQAAGGGAQRPTVLPGCEGAWTRAANAWERAKRPEFLQYCDLVGSARAKLSAGRGDPRVALDLARLAESVLADRSDALVLEGRALVAMGDGPRAAAAFRAALARDPRALDEPTAHLAWARSLALSGQPGLAAEAYQSLQPWMQSFAARTVRPLRSKPGLQP